MKQKPLWSILRYCGLILSGNILFGLGFNWFLVPHSLNVGGLSGIAMIVQFLIGKGGIGLYTALMNIPLFLLGYKYIGKSFFWGSLAGMLLNSLFIDLLAALPVPQTEPLLGAIFGGVLTGAGLGVVFLTGASTGGTDILARLLKRKFHVEKLGAVTLCLDIIVLTLTGIVFGDITKALYSAITLFLSAKVLDTVLYGMDNSCVAFIITEKHDEVYLAIDKQLDRGTTFLNGCGGYTRAPRMVLMTAVRSRQVSELKQLVQMIDPDAFMIVQPAHQVLGEGFKRYSDEI